MLLVAVLLVAWVGWAGGLLALPVSVLLWRWSTRTRDRVRRDDAVEAAERMWHKSVFGQLPEGWEDK